MLTLRASVTPADRAADPYFYLPFDVPEGTTRIDATLAYPKAADCVIDLGCLDPRAGPWPAREGFRGWSGGARDGFFVATDDATPGCRRAASIMVHEVAKSLSHEWLFHRKQLSREMVAMIEAGLAVTPSATTPRGRWREQAARRSSMSSTASTS